MPRYSRDERDHRSYDQESGMNRKKGAKPRYPPVRQVVESSEDERTTDTEAEAIAQAVVRDDSVRKTRRVKPRAQTRGKAVQEKPEAQEADQEDVEEVKKVEVKTSSHFNFLVAMARQIAPQPISFPTTSEYYPHAGNMFRTLYFMTRVVSDNLKLFEISGDYTSIGINLYYSHVFYYHILRVRNDCGQLTRLERRSLRLYETVGKPESWPIATPLIGFIQALGYVEPADKMFSLIVPKLPDITKFTANKALAGLKDVHGLGFMPIPPAYQEFLRRFGAQQTHYDDDADHYYPEKTPLSTTDKFIGIEDSRAAHNDFQALALNQCWNSAAETQEPVGQFSSGARITKVKRWNIPQISETFDYRQLETFLFGTGEHIEWMRKLLKISTAFNRHFPGSSNLGAIPTLTTAYSLVKTTYSSKTQVTVTANKWYYPRNLWNVSFKSNFFGPEVNTLIQAAVAVSINAELDDKLIPTGYRTSFGPGRTGPYFDNPTDEVSVPIAQSEGQNLHDPTQRVEELINTTMYDAQGAD